MVFCRAKSTSLTNYSRFDSILRIRALASGESESFKTRPSTTREPAPELPAVWASRRTKAICFEKLRHTKHNPRWTRIRILSYQDRCLSHPSEINRAVSLQLIIQSSIHVGCQTDVAKATVSFGKPRCVQALPQLPPGPVQDNPEICRRHVEDLTDLRGPEAIHLAERKRPSERRRKPIET